jgi:large subunit ribosomal protein L9
MKVVLRQDIDGVGRRGDIVDVADGYARNFLLPGGQGMVATKGVEAQAGAMRKARDLREANDRQAAQAKATTLAGATIHVTARAGASGRLFGSVGTPEIVEAVRAQKGVELERGQVRLEEPIKTVGTHEVPVHLGLDVATVVMVEVVAG